MRVGFQHLRSTRNIGDRATTPARWFDFGDQVTQQDFGQTLPPVDLAIYGGGQVFGQTFDAAVRHTPKARHKVAWAVGMRQQAGTLRLDMLAATLSLTGCRDVNVPQTIYVPCPSCQCTRLDTPAPPIHDVVIYAHGTKSAALHRPDGIPVMTNLGGTLAEKLAFLASGETVVSNSFHGVYWAMLMGRRVLALPFSTKFNGFARMPALADPSGWLQDLPRAAAVPGYLDECRLANQAFYQRVLALF